MARTMRPIKGEAGKFFIPALNKVVFIVEWRVDDKYDTIRIPSGARTASQTFNFFRDLTSKELNATNFTTARRLPAGEEMILRRIGVYVPTCVGNTVVAPGDIKKVLDNSYFKLTINRKDIAEGPITRFPSGYGPAGQTVETAQGVVTNGVPSTAAAATLEKEQLITEDHDIDGFLTLFDNLWDSQSTNMIAPATAVYVRAILHGLVKAAGTKG